MNKINNNTQINFTSESIFNFLNPNDNVELSKMRGTDLQELIILIDEYYLELRNTLGLAETITFGLEIEFENANENKITKKLLDAFPNNEWQITEDSSLKDGLEINSPILRDNPNTWKELEKVCKIVSPYAMIDKKSASHVHFGTQTLGSCKESWLNFIKLWSVYENIIYRFLYGEYLTARPCILEYAEPLASIFAEDYKILKKNNEDLNDIIFRISHKRKQAINFENVSIYECDRVFERNTIEFRCPNGTLNPVIWQNNVNLLARVLTYSKDNSYNDDVIEKRRKSNCFYPIELYDEIYLEQTLELCDLLFTNNLDKIYFLKQYLKSFEINKKPNSYPKAKQLVKII